MRTRVSAPRIYLVEDEPSVCEAILAGLRSAGFVALGQPDGSCFENDLEAFRPDLVILDVMLPGRDGFALARELRRRSDAPLLFLTAADTPAARLRGFDLGGDDYVVKPFLTDELIARVRAVLRRTGHAASDVIEVADMLVDEAAHTAWRGGVQLELTTTEFRLLAYLARNRGNALTRGQMLLHVWDFDTDPHVVTVYVSRLRTKLERLGPPLIHTVRGHGYALRP
jgi:DNA-binding response OmpR family regulator